MSTQMECILTTPNSGHMGSRHLTIFRVRGYLASYSLKSSVSATEVNHFNGVENALVL